MPHPMAASAPEPKLTINRYQGVISGARMDHAGRCFHCRASVRLWTDNGVILVGLYVSASKKTCHWYEEEHARRPVPDPQCPHCGNANKAGRWWSPLKDQDNRPYAHAISSTIALCGQVYTHLRATYPDEAAKADRADDQHKPRPPAPWPKHLPRL